MITKVSIEQAEFFAYIGYYPEERLTGNTFIVNAEVTIIAEDEYKKYNLQHSINYELIFSICKEEMSKKSDLIEDVVHTIIDRLKIHFNKAVGVKVSIQKIAPQLGGKVGKSVVEMEWSK